MLIYAFDFKIQSCLNTTCLDLIQFGFDIFAIKKAQSMGRVYINIDQFLLKFVVSFLQTLVRTKFPVVSVDPIALAILYFSVI